MRRNILSRTMVSLLLAGLIAAAATGCKRKYTTEAQTMPPAESSALTTS